MSMYIRYDCSIDTPLRILIERLDDNRLYDGSSLKFVSPAGLSPLPDSMFIPLTMNQPLPNIHAATIDTSDAGQFPPCAAYCCYVFNGPSRISGPEPVALAGAPPRVVVTVD